MEDEVRVLPSGQAQVNEEPNAEQLADWWLSGQLLAKPEDLLQQLLDHHRAVMARHVPRSWLEDEQRDHRATKADRDRLGNELQRERARPEGTFDQWARLQRAEETLGLIASPRYLGSRDDIKALARETLGT